MDKGVRITTTLLIELLVANQIITDLEQMFMHREMTDTHCELFPIINRATYHQLVTVTGFNCQFYTN